MKSQNTKSSDQLKKEVDKEIRNVKRDLDEIEGRLSPGQIIDDAIFYPHGKNLRSTLDHLKRNPVGTTFLSLGTILLMEDESHQTFEANARIKINSARSNVNERVSTVKSSIKEHLPHKDLQPGTAPSKGDILKGKVNEVKEGLKAKADGVRSSVEDMKSSVQGKVDDAKATLSAKKDELSEKKDELQSSFQEKTSDISSQFGSDAGAYDGGVSAGLGSEESSRGQRLKEKASDLYSSSKDKVQNLDPMAFMALGAGLGALTGASLPVSEKEQNFVADKLTDKFSSISQELQDAINESSNILKDLVIGDVKDMSFKVFR